MNDLEQKVREFKCPYCEVEGKTKQAVLRHIEICHPGREKRVNKV